MQYLRSIGKNEREKNVGRRNLSRFRQRGEDDLFGLPSDYLRDRRLLDALFRHQSLEGGRFKYAEPDVKADCGHDDAQQKWYAPPPNQELVAGKPTKGQDCHIGE